jgi:hypothetical protein
MKNEAKVRFLRHREYQLDGAVETLANNIDRFADHEMYAAEFSDFTNRIEALLRDLKKIRADVGDKADELGGAA